MTMDWGLEIVTEISLGKISFWWISNILILASERQGRHQSWASLASVTSILCKIQLKQITGKQKRKLKFLLVNYFNTRALRGSWSETSKWQKDKWPLKPQVLLSSLFQFWEGGGKSDEESRVEWNRKLDIIYFLVLWIIPIPSKSSFISAIFVSSPKKLYKSCQKSI